MARLGSIRYRLRCGHCGLSTLAEAVHTDERGEHLDEAAAYRPLIESGWLVLPSLAEAQLWLCPTHAGVGRNASAEQVQFLLARHRAWLLAEHYGLAFVVHGEKLISESEERRATWAELVLWETLSRKKW